MMDWLTDVLVGWQSALPPAFKWVTTCHIWLISLQLNSRCSGRLIDAAPGFEISSMQTKNNQSYCARHLPAFSLTLWLAVFVNDFLTNCCFNAITTANRTKKNTARGLTAVCGFNVHKENWTHANTVHCRHHLLVRHADGPCRLADATSSLLCYKEM